MLAAERYVRRGTAVPEIYHGTLHGIRRALADTQRHSKVTAGPHVLEAVYPGGRIVLRVFEDGQCTWTATAQDKEEA